VVAIVDDWFETGSQASAAKSLIKRARRAVCRREHRRGSAQAFGPRATCALPLPHRRGPPRLNHAPRCGPGALTSSVWRSAISARTWRRVLIWSSVRSTWWSQIWEVRGLSGCERLDNL
jgi:hypothetical protein